MSYWDSRGHMGESVKAEYRLCQVEHRDAWFVEVRNGNYSAFNGGRFTPSDYSQIRCGRCRRSWRTKAAYVRDLPSTPRRDQED